jgi:bifunctional non-homologous end joining protein LigD
VPGKQEIVKIGGRELSISNLDKVFFPGNGFTKGDVIAFYSGIADVLLPHLRDRPLTMKRFPDGVTGKLFYEKNAPKHTPNWVKTFPVPRTEGGPNINYILCNDHATLVWLANLADIEKHVLLARQPKLDIPTSIVFDLDPGAPAGILQCAEVALHLRDLLKRWKLETFVKVSGSKGLHLTVPLNTPVTYEVTQPFAKSVAELVTNEMPKVVVAGMSKEVRKGKVFIDWSQNSDFKTTVCVYAMRAKGLTPFVSMPVEWNELERALKRKDAKSLSFTPEAALKRIKKVGDLFAAVLKLKQKLPAAFVKALAAGPPPKMHRWPRNEKPAKATAGDTSLRAYRAKRDFSKTAEPEAAAISKALTKKRHHRYVIQKHEASRLHYDWRLEMEGVLRSWAVPKGPPTEVKEVRLAMNVEDHPLAYEHFEGTIPPGNYGAGTVMVWDYGVYEDITGNAAAAFHSGKMHLVLKGEKLEGEWILVKDKREPESNRWLLIKAGKSMKPISARMDDRSALTKRSMTAIAKDNDAQWKSSRPSSSGKKWKVQSEAPSTGHPSGSRQAGRLSAETAKMAIFRTPPEFVEPMKCKAVNELPENGDWFYEIKFDGYRCMVVKDSDMVRLLSRNENDFNERFPKLAKAFERFTGRFVIDGEVVALDRKDRPSFQLLQNNKAKPDAIYFYAFDLLNDDGEDLQRMPLEQRRERLNTLLSGASDPIRPSALLPGSPRQVLKAVEKLGLEGVVAKRQGSLYEPGERSGAWVKQRIDRRQEFVIGGYVPGTNTFDSLLVGVFDGKALHFVAKVKDGFVPRLRTEIFREFKGLGTDTCPFVNLPEKKGARRGDAITKEKIKECRWLKPRLVCEVGFVEWTDTSNLRHAKFVAMRDDKEAREVMRET